VLLGGCDKTIPALLMAAASVDLPALVVPGGPMLTGHFRGVPLGCGTDVWRFEEEVRAGRLPAETFLASESAMIRSRGHCNTMGTASTMACLAEALGTTLPGLAGRLGIDLTLDDFDRIGSGVPLLVDLQPAGRHLMDDFHRAGGLRAVLREVADLLDPEAGTVTGRPLVEHLADAELVDTEVIRPRGRPLQEAAGIAVLRGNLCPDGAVIKPAAATPELLRHRGRAVVFDSIEDLHARLDDPALEVDETSVLVLRGCGPKGYPGMPEVGNMALPARLLERGVRDMVRVSDGRMSGTAYGTVVLHVAPEAAAGGPLALVRTGDPIVLDVPARRLELDVPAADLARRTPPTAATAAYAAPASGWQRLYIDHVLQADRGADLDFLVGRRGHEVTRESH